MPHVGRRGTKYWLNSLLNALPRTDGQRSSCDRHSRVTHPSLVSDILVSAEEEQSLSPVPVLRVGPQPPGTQDFPVSMGEGEGRGKGGPGGHPTGAQDGEMHPSRLENGQ